MKAYQDTVRHTQRRHATVVRWCRLTTKWFTRMIVVSAVIDCLACAQFLISETGQERAAGAWKRQDRFC